MSRKFFQYYFDDQIVFFTLNDKKRLIDGNFLLLLLNIH